MIKNFIPSCTNKFSHENLEMIGVLLVNLGTPKYPRKKEIRKYLSEFLSDPRVVEIPRAIWIPILYGIVLLSRPKKLESQYKNIWMKEGSPLMVYSQKQAIGLSKFFNQSNLLNVKIELAMRYGNPSIGESLEELIKCGCEKILVVPMYPQYSSSTTASVIDEVNRYLKNLRNQPNIRFIKRFHKSEHYIQALVNQIRTFWKRKGNIPQALITSFHGLPESYIKLGDPYYQDCLETASLIQERLDFPEEKFIISFQSRFGFSPWLKPSTDSVLKKLVKSRIKKVDIICPGFVCDCLETLEEIARESKAKFLKLGGVEFRYIPALNDDPLWIEGLYSMVLHHIRNW